MHRALQHVGLLLELFNGEYERVVSQSATAGVGGSFITRDDVDYVNADAFFRFYPQGDPLDGWAFGAKAGITKIDDIGSYFGFGFDVNRSWLLGPNDNFYVGVGLGLKRLVGAGDGDFELEFIPTFGPTIAAVPGVISAFLISPQTALYVAIYYAVLQQLQREGMVFPLRERSQPVYHITVARDP